MKTIWAVLAALVFAAEMAGAETVLGEVTGNWAGASGQGFDFRAVLSDENGQARLRIWQGMGAEALQGEPQLDLMPVVYRDTIVAGDHQGLELQLGPDATTLRIVTDSDDEQYEFHEVVSVQFLDFQFTVTGYEVRLIDYADATGNYSCTLDLQADSRTVNGQVDRLAPRAFEDDNLSSWGPDAALTKGLCPPPA